jgi:hypothetical protein
MGNQIPFPPVNENVDSITCPGEKCVLTEPLTEFIDDIDQLWASVLMGLQDPRESKIKQFLCKDLQVKYHDDGHSFTVTMNWDCDALEQTLGLPKYDIPNLYKEKFVNHVYPDRRYIVQSHWKGVPSSDEDDMKSNGVVPQKDEDGLIKEFESHTRIHDNPIRVEMWTFYELTPERTRLYGPLVQFICFILCCFSSLEQKAKCHFHYGVKSITSDGEAIISDALDEYFTYDELFPLFTDLFIKNSPKMSAASLGGDFVGGPQAEDVNVETLSDIDTEVRWTLVAKPGKLPGGDPDADDRRLQFSLLIKADQTDGRITYILQIDGTLFEQTFLHILEDPLRIELYSLGGDGRRYVTRQQSIEMMLLMETLINQRDLVMF